MHREINSHGLETHKEGGGGTSMEDEQHSQRTYYHLLIIVNEPLVLFVSESWLDTG
jgi:hypothetical protein